MSIDPPEFLKTLWTIFSWTHWIVWVGFLYTCYYYRYFIGKMRDDPSECGEPEDKNNYAKENSIKQWHRIFVWLIIIFTIIYITKLVAPLLGYKVYSFGKEVTGLKILGVINVIAVILLLASSHYIRYICGSGTRCFSCLKLGKQRQKAFSFQSVLNNYHGHFFWIAIVSALLLHFLNF